MNNTALQLKIKQRLNKLSSNDYDNIQKWHIVEAFNKAQLNWCRRQLHGTNTNKEGDEGSKRRIDDLQILLTDKKLSTTDKGLYVESEELPEDYFEWKRVDVDASSECCPNTHPMVVYLAEEANVNVLLKDYNKKPSYEWGETFCTLKNNHVNVYTNKDFTIGNIKLVYYRFPKYIELKGSKSPYNNGEVSEEDVECEFKDDIVELMLDETVKIISEDIEALTRKTTSEENVELNN